MKQLSPQEEFTRDGAFLGLVSYFIVVLIITMVFYFK